jgi:SAM-dependent methyltransferase
MNNWFDVWGNKGDLNTGLIANKSFTTLEKMIALNGFDTPLGMMKEEDWIHFVESIKLRCNITKSDTIFEVGCGSGAFLFPFVESGYLVSGIDFSEKLIQKGMSLSSKLKLVNSEAANMPLDPKYDVLLSNHVYHYFQNLEYAKDVLKKMIIKSKRVISITGLPNIEYQKESELYRRGLLGTDEYKRKYRGLDLLYFDFNFFQKIANEYNCSVTFYNHEMPGFAQNSFRFDVLLTHL